MPLWIYTLGREFFGDDIHIPFDGILRSLAALVIPLTVGTIFIYYKKHMVEQINKWIKVFKKNKYFILVFNVVCHRFFYDVWVYGNLLYNLFVYLENIVLCLFTSLDGIHNSLLSCSYCLSKS